MIQNYVQLIKRIIDYSSNEDIIHTAGEGDIYKINEIPNLDYPIFWISSTNAHVEFENYITYNLTLYYVDRQLEGSDMKYYDDNAMIITAGMSVLSNIIKGLKSDKDIYAIADAINYNTFLASDGVFNDKCAGVYCNVSISVPKDNICYR